MSDNDDGHDRRTDQVHVGMLRQYVLDAYHRVHQLRTIPESERLDLKTKLEHLAEAIDFLRRRYPYPGKQKEPTLFEVFADLRQP